MKKLIIPALLFIMLGCVKEEWKLNDQFEVDGLDPSFAISLVEARLNLGNIEQELDTESFIYNEQEQVFALVYSDRIFNFQAGDLSDLNSQNFTVEHSLSSGEAASLNALNGGQQITFDNSSTLNFAVNNGEELDSILFGSGMLAFDIESSIAHDLEITITIPSMTLDGNELAQTITLTYPGNTPFSAAQQIDLSGYTLDLTDGGQTNNTFDVLWSIEVTSTGQSSSNGDGVEIDLSIDLGGFHAIYGYLGQLTQATSVDTQFVDIFRDLNNGVLHFVDPRVELTIFNSTGIPASVAFSSVYAPENAVAQEMGGSDIDNFPIVASALMPGEVAITEHTFSNLGTVPDLTSILDEGPFKLVYTTALTTNPQGLQQNFLLDTSALYCDVDLVLPFYGYADNFSLRDTLDLDIADELGVGEEDVLSWEDIKRVTIRLIADNGLPVDVEGQVYFADSLNTIIDSLFVDHFEMIIQRGFVDFGLDPNDPNYGKVTAPTWKITDIILTKEQVKYLIDHGSTKVILNSRANTNESYNGEVVRFYPEYNLNLKLSAKVDTDIDLTE